MSIIPQQTAGVSKLSQLTPWLVREEDVSLYELFKTQNIVTHNRFIHCLLTLKK